MKTTFTPEQTAALDAFEKAAESYDLRAMGFNRKHAACCWLSTCADKLKELGIDNAMTPAEANAVRAARNFID